MNVKAVATAGVAGVLFAAVLLLLLPLMIAGAAAGPPPSAPCGPGGTGQRVGAVLLDAEQMGNAQTVVSVTAQRGLPAYAATVALATVAAESMFHNYLVFKDSDSLGLFQQRVRYYTAPVAANPARATNAFLDRLVTVGGWATRPLTEVAAAVQMPRQDLRGAYAKWQPLGAALTARLWPRASATSSTTRAAGPSAAPWAPPHSAPPGTVPADPCGVTGTGPAGGSAAIPPGLALTGSPAGNHATAFALAQLGKPYLWGSTGPSSWDCSSLVQAGWALAGVAIARTTFAQVNDGIPVALAAARSGDLVFIAGTNGSAANPGHVGMVAGRVGVAIYLVAAPRSGEVVAMTPVAQWASQIVAVRRIG
jgi:cell wall-associated NlpC family hydrolase